MRILKLVAKIAAALMGVVVLVVLGVFFYFHQRLNPYSLESRSMDWRERFRRQPADWKPVPGRLMTRWAADVSPDNVLPEYPRPQMTREDWLNLNGIWSVGVVPKEAECVADQGYILVPFPIESALSGVKQPLLPGERLCYQRAFSVPEGWEGKRLLLHFGAVDWEAVVRVNGHEVGSHRGGYSPFSFDISPHVVHGESNQLEVAVWDPTDLGTTESFKQRHVPFRSTTPRLRHLADCLGGAGPEDSHPGHQITPDIDSQTVPYADDEAEVDASGAVTVGGKEVVTGKRSANPSPWHVPTAGLWSPDSPKLYPITVNIGKDDSVKSYFAMRKISIGKDAAGITRMLLNDQFVFQHGPLDQGYWPDGLYTAPTDAALKFDVEMIKEMGFNTLRKHVKVEPARFYYHCDKLGMLVWQDMPSLRPGLRVMWAMFFDRDKKDDDHASFGRADEASRHHYKQELKAMIDALYNAPSIGVWVPFNEGWGQFDAAEIAEWTKSYDPTRIVDHASGWFDQEPAT